MEQMKLVETKKEQKVKESRIKALESQIDELKKEKIVYEGQIKRFEDFKEFLNDVIIEGHYGLIIIQRD